MKTKQMLRSYIQDVFSEKEISFFGEQNDVINKKILNYITIKKSSSIALFVGIKNEIQTGGLIEKLLKDGKRVFLPKIVSQTEMQLIEVQSLQGLEAGKLGILEPDGEKYYKGDIDVFFVPGVAFTGDGKRIGKGKGYYDRFLAQERYKKSLKVGVCYDFQIVDGIPVDDWDVVMDEVIYN